MENLENKILDENSFINDVTNNEGSFFGNREVKDYLIEASKWGRFLAIVGFVGMGLFVVLAIFIMSGFSQLDRNFGGGLPTASIGFMYLLFGAIYFFPIWYLYQFSIKIKQGLQSSDLPTVTSGFQNLKSLFRFMGIFTIVILSMYALILAIAIPTMLLFK